MGRRDDDATQAADFKPSEIDNGVKDPDQWKSGDDAITGAQRSYIDTLCGGDQACVIDAAKTLGVDVPDKDDPFSSLTKADAGKIINQLKGQ